jgi:Dockerin type I domain
MKHLIVILISIILLTFHLGFSEDLVYINSKIIGQAPCSFDIHIEIENDDIITEANMGFRLWAVGNAVFEIYDVSVVPGSRFEGALPWNFIYDGSLSDTFLIVGGPVIPGQYEGIPAGPLTQAFNVTIDVSEYYWDLYDTCVILIDTCSFVPPAGNWMWNYATPSFNYEYGPSLIQLGFLPCGIVQFTTVPDNDILTGNHCDSLQFQFEAANETGYPTSGYGICLDEGLAEIDNFGLFTFYPNEPEIYNLLIQAWDICPLYGQYTFDVVLTNDGVGYKFCPTIPLYKLFGSDISYDFGMMSLDCDPITLETVTMISSPGSDPINTPSMTDGIFTWIPDQSEIGTWVFEVCAEDEFGAGGSCDVEIIVTDDISGCGDANSDSEVNVSDAVFIINFVFVGGAAPEHWEWANVNCDGAINVSDAVWIINYVFVGGAAPCEC